MAPAVLVAPAAATFAHWRHCPVGSMTGRGGTGGSSSTSNSINYSGCAGQGEAEYRNCLALAAHHNLSAGEGGSGQRTSTVSVLGGSGGGGGGLVDGNAPQRPAGRGHALHSLAVFKGSINQVVSRIHSSDAQAVRRENTLILVRRCWLRRGRRRSWL